MAEKEELDPRLKTALNLDGSPEAIKRFYADWAETYDKQTAEWNYAAPSHAVAFLQQLDGDERVAMNALDPGIRIMDAGCGTGSLARLLSAAGYRKIDGFDLSEDMVETAFTSFVRADPSRARATGGAGLGLAIAEGMVRAHGGEIWAEAGPGGRVAFRLPSLAASRK